MLYLVFMISYVGDRTVTVILVLTDGQDIDINEAIVQVGTH